MPNPDTNTPLNGFFISGNAREVITFLVAFTLLWFMCVELILHYERTYNAALSLSHHATQQLVQGTKQREFVLPSGLSYPSVARSKKGDLLIPRPSEYTCQGAEDPRCKKGDLQAITPQPPLFWSPCTLEAHCRKV
jgi:hypothetical protein